MIDISSIFDNLKPTYAVNAAIELFGSMFIIVAIIMAFFMKLEKGMFRLVMFAGLFTALAATSDAIAAVFRGMPGETARWVIVLSNFFGVFGLFGCSVFYSNVLFYTYKDIGTKSYRIFQIIACTMGILLTIILIVSQFTGWLYVIDENNLYKRGPLFFISSGYTLMTIVSTVVYMIIRRKQSKSKVSLHAALYIVIPTLGIILQSIFYGGVFLQVSLFLLMMIILTRIQTLNARRIIEQSETISKNEIELTQVHEQLLLGQVQPHFIYNTLFAIRSIEGNPDKTVQAITEFSDYMRANLSVLDGKKLISFEQELECVKDYVALQKLRFGDKINVLYDIQDSDFSIPSLSVEILVENAIKHGISVRYDSGTITISSHKENDFHIIVVSDDGVGFDTEKLKNTDRVGIHSVKSRLEYFLGGTVSVDSEIGKGTSEKIKITCITVKN